MWRARRTIALQKYGVVAERRACFAARLVQAFGEFRRRFSTTRMPRPPPPNAALTISGKPISRATLLRLLRGFETASSVPGTTGTPACSANLPRRGLIAEQFEQLGAGPDEGDAGLLAGARQRRILGQESIARMDGIDALFARQSHDALHVEIGFHRTLALADQVGFVGFEAVQGQAVFLRIDGDRAQAQLVGGAQNADGDFAAIERQQLSHLGA